MIKKFRSGKFNIEGAYTFAIPDVLACLQWWFTDERELNNLGFVKENEVCCNLFEDGEELDCLRSPHLDHAHCIRKNKIKKKIHQWMKSNGVYIGVKDTMSKLLMYDNDGDKLLVHRNNTIIDCAKRFQEKYGMIPNYYEMPKANPSELNNSTLYEGIVLAYHHGNIGTPSNEITKIFMTLSPDSTKEEVEEAIKIVALRCVDVNFTIDYAKTLYKPTRPDEINRLINNYISGKLPHFFKYAKDKSDSQVEKIGCGFVDSLESKIKNKPLRYNIQNFGKFNYRNLMKNKFIEIDDIVIDTYNKLNRKYHYQIEQKNKDNVTYIIKIIKEELLSFEYDLNDVCNMLEDY
jgi:hypothetical protein